MTEPTANLNYHGPLEPDAISIVRRGDLFEWIESTPASPPTSMPSKRPEA